MRSGFAFFHDLDRRKLETSLNEMATPSHVDILEEWRVLTAPDDTILYIHIEQVDETFRLEWEESDTYALTEALGGAPTIYVSVDVSGRHPGRPEAIQFLIELLERHDGVATSDYDANHFWTVSELRADEIIEGRKFFTFTQTDQVSKDMGWE